MAEFNSRTADKFVVRLPDGVRDQVQDKAKQSRHSMNNWIVVAIEEKLDRDQRAQLAVDALVAKALAMGGDRS